VLDKCQRRRGLRPENGHPEMQHERVRRKRRAYGKTIIEIVLFAHRKPERIIPLFRYFACHSLRADAVKPGVQAGVYGWRSIKAIVHCAFQRKVAA
jgi:hypothetical protein